jgi:ketosteroid isomerase-like protein
MSAEENKALVRRFYEEIDKGNLAAMDELVAEGYINHHPPPFPGLAPGREGLKQAFKLFWEATPGYHQIEDQVADGDKVVTRLTVYGRIQTSLDCSNRLESFLRPKVGRPKNVAGTPAPSTGSSVRRQGAGVAAARPPGMGESR